MYLVKTSVKNIAKNAFVDAVVGVVKCSWDVKV